MQMKSRRKKKSKNDKKEKKKDLNSNKLFICVILKLFYLFFMQK